jgi:hypothetical protein
MKTTVRRRYMLMLGGSFVAIMTLGACGGGEEAAPLPETVPAKTVPENERPTGSY